MTYLIVIICGLVGGALVGWTSAQEHKSVISKPMVLQNELVPTLLVTVGAIAPLIAGFVLAKFLGAVVALVGVIIGASIIKSVAK
jgi:hypothetical protein